MTSPSVPTALPEGLPRSVVQGLVSQLITPVAPVAVPGTQPGGPGDVTIGGQPGQVMAPAGPPGPGALPPGAPPAALPAPGQAPAPGQMPGPQESQGLTDEQAELLKTLMADPESRKQIQQIVKKVSGEKRGSGKIPIDPAVKLQLAQGWNARIGELGLQMNAARSQNPGASKASDEALLRIYYMTPIAPWAPPETPFPIPLSDIDEYADAVRLHLVRAGWTDVGKIEDQVVRECFPLREVLIAAGRQWRQRVEFVDQMISLTDRWLKQYGHLPRPDLAVLRATQAGKGDPESQARDTDSSAYPRGGFRSPV